MHMHVQGRMSKLLILGEAVQEHAQSTCLGIGVVVIRFSKCNTLFLMSEDDEFIEDNLHSMYISWNFKFGSLVLLAHTKVYNKKLT